VLNTHAVAARGSPLAQILAELPPAMAVEDAQMPDVPSAMTGNAAASRVGCLGGSHINEPVCVLHANKHIRRLGGTTRIGVNPLTEAIPCS